MVTINIPGFAGGAGGETIASDAAMSSLDVVEAEGVATLGVELVSEDSLPLIVEVEVERPDKELLSGPR